MSTLTVSTGPTYSEKPNVPSARILDGAHSLLTAGNVSIEKADRQAGLFIAYVTGSQGDRYQVTLVDGTWYCSCPARAQFCKHVVACQVVFSPLS